MSLKSYASLILFIISLSIFIFSINVFAWMVFVGRKPLASFESGEIVVTARINGNETLETFNLTSLCFIDFQNDVVLNGTNTLNKSATVFTVRIINGEQSAPVKNTILLYEEFNKKGLLFLIIYDGKNIVNGNVDYFANFQSIIGLETTEEIQRNLIENYNNETLNTIQQERLEPGEYLFFRVAIWGDYNQLDNPQNYLNETFSLKLKINSQQVGGV